MKRRVDLNDAPLLAPQQILQPFKERSLFLTNEPGRRSKLEPRATVDLRDRNATVRFRRPFDLTCIAHELSGIAFTSEGPCLDDFAALLSHRTEFEKWTVRGEPCLFDKLTLRCSNCLFVLLIFTLRYCPGSLIFPGPIGASGMHEENLIVSPCLAEHEKTSTLFCSLGHPHYPTNLSNVFAMRHGNSMRLRGVISSCPALWISNNSLRAGIWVL